LAGIFLHATRVRRKILFQKDVPGLKFIQIDKQIFLQLPNKSIYLSLDRVFAAFAPLNGPNRKKK
jgi:hypothetical protein